MIKYTLQHIAFEHRDLITSMSVASWFRGALVGVKHMHELGWLHRDLKPANMLVDLQVLKICDFGTSILASADQPIDKIYTTAAYAAPELYRGFKYTSASEVWSVGISAYEVIAQINPYLTSPSELSGVDGVQALSILKPRHAERDTPIVPISPLFLIEKHILQAVSSMLQL